MTDSPTFLKEYLIKKNLFIENSKLKWFFFLLFYI